MAAEIKNITLKQGADYEGVIEFWDDDGNIDISGDTFEASIKEHIDDLDANVKAAFVFVVFQDTEDENKWKVRITLSDTVINALTIKKGVYDMFRIFSDGFRANPFEGNITVKKKVTPTVAP